MATLRQIEANRLNAKKSTGPRTPEGKIAVRFNALQHGIDARFFVIPGERQYDLDELAIQYYEQFCPKTPVSCYLVDTLVQCDWMRRRLMRLQAAFFRALAPERCDDAEEPIHGVERMNLQPESLSRLFRQLATMERHYFRALAELRRLADEPPAADPEPEPAPDTDPVPQSPAEAATRPAPPPQSKIGFVPPKARAAQPGASSHKPEPGLCGAGTQNARKDHELGTIPQGYLHVFDMKVIEAKLELAAFEAGLAAPRRPVTSLGIELPQSSSR